MTTIVLGISGRAGAGKTTFARMVLEEIRFPGDFGGRILPFAEPVKDIARQMGWDGKKDAKGRRLLQLLGTECGRECIGPDVWVDAWSDEVDLVRDRVRTNAVDGVVVLVADDVRFPNEARAVRERGGIVIEIERAHGLGWWRRLLASLKPTHVSERGIRGDERMANDGTLADFRAKAVLVAELLKTQIDKAKTKDLMHEDQP